MLPFTLPRPPEDYVAMRNKAPTVSCPKVENFGRICYCAEGKYFLSSDCSLKPGTLIVGN